MEDCFVEPFDYRRYLTEKKMWKNPGSLKNKSLKKFITNRYALNKTGPTKKIRCQRPISVLPLIKKNTIGKKLKSYMIISAPVTLYSSGTGKNAHLGILLYYFAAHLPENRNGCI
jgi:hypothetical protein